MSLNFWRVERSYLTHVAYDEPNRVLVVVFGVTKRNPARAWLYFEVEPEVAYEFAEAVAPGSMFSTQIKDAYAQSECGATSAEAALRMALEAGFTTFAVSGRAAFDVITDVLDEDELEERLHVDEDCEGNHLYLLGPEIDDERGAMRHLWHLNLSSGLVVPPLPRLVGR